MARGNAPIKGCTISPDRGPATNTIDMRDLESPRERRYGDAVWRMKWRMSQNNPKID